MSVKIQRDSPKGTTQRKEETMGWGATARHKLHVSHEGRLVLLLLNNERQNLHQFVQL